MINSLLMEEKDYLIALSQSNLFGPLTLLRLRSFFGSFKRIWQAPLNHLSRSPCFKINLNLKEEKLLKFQTFRQTNSPGKIIQRLNYLKIKTICLEEEAYPYLLKQTYDPPPLLYYKGRLEIFKKPCLAIVGSRKIDKYSEEATKELTTEAVKLGFTIISGLARGIDSIAHLACLNNQGLTVAVMATGAEKIYPPENWLLAQRIIEQGCLISEFPPGVNTKANHFPRRNRLIAGLSLGVLVIGAPIKSGALITAEQALRENREIMTIPGPIFNPLHEGSNNLLKLGAIPICSYLDLGEALQNLTVTQ